MPNCLERKRNLGLISRKKSRDETAVEGFGRGNNSALSKKEMKENCVHLQGGTKKKGKRDLMSGLRKKGKGHTASSRTKGKKRTTPVFKSLEPTYFLSRISQRVKSKRLFTSEGGKTEVSHKRVTEKKKGRRSEEPGIQGETGALLPLLLKKKKKKKVSFLKKESASLLAEKRTES